MLFFKRKKKEEEDEEEKPKRVRKKKEEPPKPWGKKERYTIFGILALTVGAAGFLALSARSWKVPGLPRLTVPQDVLQETYVFEGKPVVRDTKPLFDSIKFLTNESSGVYGLYVINLNSDESYGVNEDEIFQAASLIKLPVMLSMYIEHEKKNIDLDDTYVLKNEDKVGGSGSLYSQEAGTEYSYRELVNKMGQQSDNTAFNVGRKILGDSLVNEYITEFGMTNTSLADNETTPQDIGIYFKKLWSGKLVSRKSRDEILKSLTKTIYEEYIPVGIPDVRTAHKYGREINVVNDAGIVFATNPYVLVIMSKGIIDKEANEIIPEIARLVHKFEEASD